MIRKIKYFVLCFLCLFLLLGFCGVDAKEEDLPTPDSYVEEMIEALPDEGKELLSDFTNSSNVADAVTPEHLLMLSHQFIKEIFQSVGEYLSVFLIAVVLGSLAHRTEEAFSEKPSGIASLVSVLVISLESFSILYRLFNEVLSFVTRVNQYMMTSGAIMGSVLILGGGTVEAGKTSLFLTALVTLLGTVIGALLLPVIRISFAASISTAISDKVNLSSVGSFVRGFFAFTIGILSTVAVVTLTFQTLLAQAEDTLVARGIRFAASSSIPIVGGAVSESMRTLGASVTLIKRSVGTVGAVGILIMAFYPLSMLFSARLAVSIAKIVSELLGIKKEVSVFSEVGGIINMLLAVVAIISLLYIFVMALFAAGTVPIA